MNIHLDLNENKYDIIVERGILEKAGEQLNLNRRVLVVTDSGVPAIYAQALAKQCKSPIICTVESGEASKSIETFTKLLHIMLENDFSRKDCVVAVGGMLETAVIGIPEGVGEPWFDSVESLISHMMFSIPAVKGVEFGAGFSFADMKGSTANDPLRIENERILTETNNNAGINGGITNGMPIIFRTVIKPTPTIFKPQNTVDFKDMTETVIEAKGRHDPAIVHRARIVQDAATAIVLCDILSSRFGTDWLKGSE